MAVAARTTAAAADVRTARTQALADIESYCFGNAAMSI